MSQVLPREVFRASAPAPPVRVSRALLQAVRPKQWAKNVLVFAAPFAAGVLNHSDVLYRAGAAFLVFCALASGTYVLNDVIDAAADRQHPVKGQRPVAAGLLSVPIAISASVFLYVTALGGASSLGWRMLLVAAVYVGLQIAYCLRLKNEPVFDLACVAAGFVLRAIAGGVATGLAISQWFLIVATFGALLIVSGKRFAEHHELGERRGSHRPALDAYSPDLLRGLMQMSAAIATTAYCLWAFERQAQIQHHPHGILFQLSIVPFVLAILRYVYMVDSGHGGIPEDVIFSDRSLLVVGLAWLTLFGLGVYAA
jgi:decaprenyl-phosphate phosphoribosyltransferase